MFKYGWKWHLLWAIVGIVLWCVWCSGCTQEQLTSEQTAQIEKLSQLKRYDMVMDKRGFVHMVVRTAHQERQEKASWELTLQQEYMRDNPTYELITLAKDEEIKQIFHQDDPQWAVAALCYLKTGDCRTSLKQK